MQDEQVNLLERHPVWIGRLLLCTPRQMSWSSIYGDA